jgi:predicted MFS family arabinose efflux permease
VPPYAWYVLGVLTLSYAVNVMDRAVLNALLESIKHSFTLSDTQLGLLGGLAFALFYSTVGIPIAALADRSNRKNVLAAAISLWSVMTALCGAAVNFTTLFAARAGTAVGESGGTPPSHSLISDYFAPQRRATALALYAFGVPTGTMLGLYLGGWGDHAFGWRTTFMMLGLPGLAVALLVYFTVREPQRGHSEGISAKIAAEAAPRITEVFKFLWTRQSFRHLCLAAALHSVVWYAGSALNSSFLQRSHGMNSKEAGAFLAYIALAGAIGTFFGGFASDRLSTRTGDKRWYMWLPGIATLAAVPFQFFAYLADDQTTVAVTFSVMTVFAAMFFGPSFAVTQALATLRMRAIAISILLFVQTLIGLGLGPFFAGVISDLLKADMGSDSLRYGLVIVGLANIWATVHYFAGARSLRANLEETTRLLART